MKTAFLLKQNRGRVLIWKLFHEVWFALGLALVTDYHERQDLVSKRKRRWFDKNDILKFTFYARLPHKWSASEVILATKSMVILSFINTKQDFYNYHNHSTINDTDSICSSQLFHSIRYFPDWSSIRAADITIGNVGYQCAQHPYMSNPWQNTWHIG